MHRSALRAGVVLAVGFAGVVAYGLITGLTPSLWPMRDIVAMSGVSVVGAVVVFTVTLAAGTSDRAIADPALRRRDSVGRTAA